MTTTKVKVATGDIWVLNGREYKIGTVDGKYCSLYLDGGLVNEHYPINEFVGLAAWKKKETILAKRYVTTYCAAGCGAVHIIKPGEPLGDSFTCSLCQTLPANPRRRIE